jgi:hypothetical protein
MDGQGMSRGMKGLCCVISVQVLDHLVVTVQKLQDNSLYINRLQSVVGVV